VYHGQWFAADVGCILLSVMSGMTFSTFHSDSEFQSLFQWRQSIVFMLSVQD